MPREARITSDLANDRVRLGELREPLKKLARQNERSLAAEIRVAVKAYLRASERTLTQ